MNFNKELKNAADKIEAILKSYLPKEEGPQKTIIEAMNYSLLAGGKRLRPMLMQEIYYLFGGTGKVIEPFMAAIEMIHTYSLVHDDLPAMDNDEYRRGRKTTHIVFGEGMAILAGDALLNYAFETALQAFSIEPDNAGIPSALRILAGKAGIYGMIGGQTADIEAEAADTQISKETLMFIHEFKTGALIQSTMTIGAALAGASEDNIEIVSNMALSIGTAFQIQDDILDVTGTEEVLGKAIGSDEKNNKTTYVLLEGLDKSKEDVAALSMHALDALATLPGKNTFLEALILSLISREK